MSEPANNTPENQNPNAFEKFEEAGGLKGLESAFKETYSADVKRVGGKLEDFGKSLVNKTFKRNKTTEIAPAPPKPQVSIPNTQESLVLSDSTKPKDTVSTPVPLSVQPEAQSNWGHLNVNVSGTTVKTGINKGNNKYSIFGDPLSTKVGASWQDKDEKLQVSHNLSSGKNELSYSKNSYNSNFNTSIWQKGSGIGANTSYNQQINHRTQIGANAAISKESGEGVKAAASLMYTKKGPKNNIALGAIASYEKGNSFMGVSGRITF